MLRAARAADAVRSLTRGDRPYIDEYAAAMFDVSLANLLSVSVPIALAMGLALQRWQIGRLHARLDLLEQRSVVAQQAATATSAELANVQAALAQAMAAAGQTRARQSELGARVEMLESQASSDQPYGDAIRLVRQGAREGRLVDELGLSPVEAGLIVRLHGARAAH